MRRGGVLLLVLAVLAGPAGWIVTDRLERNDAFCTRCHLDAETPLHTTKMEDFLATPARNLAAFHRTSEEHLLCISCHGGASWLNRARVKTVAARDALFYVLGRFEEPTSMQHPRWDEDCARCHGRYEVRSPDDFHADDIHNLPDFDFRCVECHRAHTTSGSAELDFLEADVVLPVCAHCHEEFTP